MSDLNGSDQFGKIKKWIAGTGMPKKISPAAEHLQDKSPDYTLPRPAPIKQARKLIKI